MENYASHYMVVMPVRQWCPSLFPCQVVVSILWQMAHVVWFDLIIWTGYDTTMIPWFTACTGTMIYGTM